MDDADTKDLVPELEAQAAAPPGSDEFTFEQLGDLKAEMRADTFEKLGEMRADTFEQLGDLNAKMDEQLGDLDAKMDKMDERFDDMNAKMEAMFERFTSQLSAALAPPPATPTATPSPRPCAQDKDNAQYLEQENDGLRIQAGTKLNCTVAARPGESEPGQPTAVAVAAAESEMGVSCGREMDTVAAAESEMGVSCGREMDTVAAAEPEMGVREMDMTAAAKIFAVAHQDHYISKSIAADAPTGSTLNEPESRAFTTDPRPHAFGAENVNLTVYSRAKVKVGPLARIRIDDEVYT